MEKTEVQIKIPETKPLIIGEKVFRSANDYELSTEDVERARKELGETEEVKSKCLRKLKEKLSKDKMRYRTDDDYLLRFLRCKKYDYEAAYENIRFFYAKRKEYPDVFFSLPSKIDELLKCNIFRYFPYRDEEGSIILADKFAIWDVNELSIFDLAQIYQCIADVITMNPSCQINKIIAIIDCKDTNIRQFASALYPSTLKFWASITQNIYPWRIKYIIILNCNKLAYTSLNVVKHFFKKKILDRLVIIDSDMSKLHKYVNPALLPKEYGGFLEDSECSIAEHIMNNLDYIKYEQSYSNA